MTILTKRIYAPAAEADGYRVLVDRLWPRGIKKENARIGLWAKSLAPSNELRKWFGHDPERFGEFARRYRAELAANPDWPAFVEDVRRHDVVTLLFGAKDEAHNNAVVMAEMMRE